MTLFLYSFSKRRNSTAIPFLGGVAVDVALKRETSLNNPVFLLAGEMPAANYCAFEGAYYYIDDIVSIRDNLWELVCTIDALATLRADILATAAYVEYAAGGRRDIVDNRIAPAAVTANYSGVVDIGIDLNADHYNLAVVGITGVDTWQVSKQMLDRLLYGIRDWADGVLPQSDSVPEVLINGFKQIASQGSAMECIRACRWLPWGWVSGASGYVSLGMYQTQAYGMTVGTRVSVQNVDIDIPFTRDGFFRLQPFSDVVLYLPFVGNVNISSPRFVSTRRVNIQVSKDNVQGSIAYAVSVGGVPYGSYGADCGVDIPVGISNIGAAQVVNGITGATLAASYGNYMAAIGAAVNAAQPTPSSVGGIQGAAGAGLPNKISYALIEHGTSGAIGNMDTVLGTPVFDTKALSSISGYVKTRGASVAGNARGHLKEVVNGMLDAGVFIE